MTSKQLHLMYLIWQQISGELDGGPTWAGGEPATWDDIIQVITSVLDMAQSNKDFGLSFPVGDGLPQAE